MQNNIKKIYTINLGKERVKVNLPEENYEQLRLIQALNPELDTDEKVIFNCLVGYVKHLEINSHPKSTRWLVRLLINILGEHYFKLKHSINHALHSVIKNKKVMKNERASRV